MGKNSKQQPSTSNQEQTQKTGFERKVNKDGSINKRYVDLLDVDKPIAGQGFGCYSFISPEKILKQRELFFFEEFLKQWEMSKSMEKFHQFLNFMSFKYKLVFENVIKDFEDFVKEERDSIIKSSMENDYKTFMDQNEDKLQKQFDIKYNFQTATRGFKSRGNFATQEEAEMRAKLLREADPNFDIFVGPVGTWLCWEPEAYKTGRVEYMEEELNQLAHEKKNNETAAKSAFEQRVKESKQKAIDDNMEKAQKSGNVLTQTIDENGELVGIGNNTQEQTIKDKEESSNTISVSDIRSELFDGENIVTAQTDHGQTELLSGPFANK
jgi:hypothetical protein